ncbi:c6 transcription factor [Fusarium sp. NRRL 25303]|nr:c6 transcription factor [Fusarium sp. NRRL 25303]
MCLLLEDYFESVHWFSLVIYEPKFRAKFEAICDGYASQSQKPFLLLLSAVLALAAWYNSKRHSSVHGHDAAFWADWASTLLRHLELETFDIINGCTLEHIQICTLLASYHSYHGKPKAASALLGATIKAAQAIGLHQEPHGKSVDDTEEIKRIWWTIYTWDRWASTTLGRPLGIDDDECNISMPNEIYENRRFLAWVDAELICYSVYQRELNKLYVIASPVLKILFGNIPSSYSKGVARERQRNLLEETGKRLKNWREALPDDLVFHFDADASPDECALIKARRLQALSLQLTFDHLIIIFNHSLLVHQIRSLCGGGRTQFPTDFEQPNSKQTELSPIASSEASLHAAFHISRIAQLPQTARLAAESHLVGFLGINLLNAAIVLVVSALSSPLTDRAQEAKRSVTMIFRLQKILGERSQLALQSSLVLRSMILMITSRETEAMLRPKEATREAGLYGLNDDQTSQDDPYVLVQETVRVSLDAPFPPLQCSGVMSRQRTITGQTGEETVPLDDASAPAGKGIALSYPIAS